MRFPPLLVVLCLAATGILSAQSDASLAVGANTVRFSGGSTTSGALSPALRLVFPSAYLDANGIISTSDGIWSGVGRVSAWAATPALLGRFHLAADGSVAGTTHTGGPWTAAAHALGEVFWSGSRGGFGLAAGSSTGWIQDDASVTAFHARGRAWWRIRGADWFLSAEPTRFYGAWFTDATAGVSVTRGPVVASAWGIARLSGTYSNRTVAGASVQWYVIPNLALELGGGSYLPDPYQGLTSARYLSAGIRIHSARRKPQPATGPRDPPLTPVRQGDSLVVEFHMPGVRTVALAGDWDDWTAKPLTPTGVEHWSGSLTLPPGLYHFVLLVDGTEWVVPAGVARVPDGMGGFAALLLVVDR